ncbi:uncharacterized protein LOC124148614 [Haliotis rufescens]|uniref:uncharacterized protein LOC124148614 n=1 Tax=Haliotis rufescens TaxID=6454 RepID=UPI00201E8D45|nr:uncharacterized protein LOC124148614 [Haliotis rufescens]
MTDGKRKRLSLKNKKPSVQPGIFPDNDNNGNVSKKRKISSTMRSNSSPKNLDNIAEGNEDSEEPEIICLSDEETGNHKQVHQRSSDTVVASILDVPDKQLRELRRRLLELRRQESETGYIQELPELKLMEKQKKDGPRETTHVALLSSSDQEYSPLPQMCFACARRKPINHNFSSVVNSILNSPHSNNSSSDCNSPKVTAFKMTESCSPLKQRSSPSECDEHDQAVVTSKSLVLDSEDMSDFEEDVLMFDTEETHKMQTCEKSKIVLKNPTLNTLKDGPSSSVDAEASAPRCEDNILSACPLCTMEFGKGTSQLDIDGHIAACLSAAGDDATW